MAAFISKACQAVKQKNPLTLSLLLFLLAFATPLSAQKTFTGLEELLNYAQSKSTTLQSGEIKIAQAKKAKLAAAYNAFDPVLNTNSTFTNNTRLPVNLFPAEIFGGAPGTYREVALGVQYVTNLNQYAEVKLFNPGGWENLKLAKVNLDVISSENRITLKTLFDNIAVLYYNSVTLQEQQKSTQENLNAAETLLKTVQNKYTQGQASQQDLNDAKASYLNTQENLRQLAYLNRQNELSLKILCDIPESDSIAIREAQISEPAAVSPQILTNGLNLSHSLLREKYARVNLSQIKKSQFPTLSLTGSNTLQQNNSQFKLSDRNTQWITSNYIGLKLSFNLPSAKSVSQLYNARYDLQLAQKNTEQTRIKTELENKQLQTEHEKAISQARANLEIYTLRQDSYQKNMNLYNQGLIGIDQTINSFNAMVNANYSLISSRIQVKLAQSKIDINNKIR